MSQTRAPGDTAAHLRSLDKEELIHIIMDDAKNWLAHDGLWFQAVEAAHGMDAAIAADAAAWERFTVIEARRIMDRLGIAEGGGIRALVECLQHRLYARLNAGSHRAHGSPCRLRHARLPRAGGAKAPRARRLPMQERGPCRIRVLREDGRPADPDALSRVPARRARP